MIKKFKNSNTPLSKDEKLQQILKTARKRFSRYGYKKTTIEDVASALGMTKSNIYFYVANKRDLYEKTVRNELIQWRDSVALNVEKTRDVVEKFQIMARTSFEYLTVHTDLHQILINDPSIFTLSPEEDRFSEINKGAMNMIKEILVQGIKENRFARVDVDHTAELLFSIYVMFLIKAYVKSEGSSAIKMYHQGLALILRGLTR